MPGLRELPHRPGACWEGQAHDPVEIEGADLHPVRHGELQATRRDLVPQLLQSDTRSGGMAECEAWAAHQGGARSAMG